MPAKDKWASTSEEEVTSSRYSPVVETHRKKKKNKEPPIINNRFPGGGFAARMKKRELRSKGERHHGSKVVPYKMQLGVSSAFSKKCASRKKGGARESLIVKKERKSNTQLKVQSSKSGESSLVVNKEEEVVIEDFDSQELLQEAPVRAGGDSSAINSSTDGRKVGLGSPKVKDKGEGEMSSSKVEGLLPGTGSSKTVVINSQPQFAPSQLDRERKVLEVKLKECKQGILKKVVCSSKPMQESIPPMNLKKKHELLEDELSASIVSREHQDDESGMSCNFEEGEDQEDTQRGETGALTHKGGKMKVQQKSLEGAGVHREDNKEPAAEDENTVQEEEADALADLFSDYEVEEAQDNSEQELDTDAEAGIFSGA